MKSTPYLYLIITLLLAYSPMALASSNKIQWHLYLIGIAVISSLIAFVITKRKENLENTGIKILVWGVYFWIVTFLQLMLLSLLYMFA